MIQIRKDDLMLVLGGLFLVLVISLCMFSPYLFENTGPEESVSCDCPYCAGQLGTFNAVVLDNNRAATFVDPDTNITYRFEYVDGEGLVGGRTGPDGTVVEEFVFGSIMPDEADDEQSEKADESFGGYAGNMPAVDENGNTVYYEWANDRDGNFVK